MRVFCPPVIGLLLLICGCGYQAGPTNGVEAGRKSVQFETFSNKTLQPRLNDAVSEALRRQMQRDGTYHLATHGQPDIIVTGVLLQYDRREVSFNASDVLTVQNYRVSVIAQVTARDANSGKVIFDKKITGYTLVQVGSDLPSAERQATPLLADDLAKNVVSQLVDGSW
jgi:hypothetical protein